MQAFLAFGKVFLEKKIIKISRNLRNKVNSPAFLFRWMTHVHFFLISGCIQFGKGFTGFKENQKQNEIANVNECQEFCKENSPCKIFYWNSKSRSCFTAGHLYKDENQIIVEANSIIGLSNCTNNSQAVLESIFTTRPIENSTAYIVGAVVVLLLVGSFGTLCLVKHLRLFFKKKTLSKQISLNDVQNENGNPPG